jgi:hypothetical protein
VERAALASKSPGERAAVAAVREDRRDRLALLELKALPLLRGIAEGTLDPKIELYYRAVEDGHISPLR